jgi:hypothetical protein
MRRHRDLPKDKRRHNLTSVWRGPHATLDEATHAAFMKAQSSQMPTLVVESHLDGSFTCAHPVDRPAGKIVHTVTPNPTLSPFNRWPFVTQGATTDQATRDAIAAYWRDYADRAAARAGATNGLVPFAVKTASKAIKLHGQRITLYSYIVRRNPKFASIFPPEEPAP